MRSLHLTADCKLVDEFEFSLRVALRIPSNKPIGTLVQEKLGFPGENLVTRSDYCSGHAYQ